jgi:uncharacterized membrane protein YhhN
MFFSIAASLMYVLVAVGSRTGVRHQTYYVLVLIGLCISLASDILFALSGAPRKGKIIIEEHVPEKRETFSGNGMAGSNYSAAGHLFSAAAGAAYIGAFYSYAPFSWYDAVFFALLAALVGALIYNMKRPLFRTAGLLLYVIVLCAMSAKALSLLLVPGKGYLYSVLAASGAMLFAYSNIMRAVNTHGSGKLQSIFNVSIYYCAQALIALSVMI